MDLKLQRLNSGERVAAGSALALFVCMFFGWFNFGFDADNAWESLHFISPILAIAIAATAGIAFMKASERSLGDIPEGSLIFVLGCLATVLIFFRLVDPVSLSGAEGFQASGSVEAGLFLGLLAAAGIAVGGYMATGGTALDQLKALLPNEGPAPPAPPHAAPPPPPSPSPSPTPPPAPAVAPVPANPPAAAPQGSAFCEECGAALAAGDRFCSACGSEQSASPG
jgi:hypothetical protein